MRHFSSIIVIASVLSLAPSVQAEKNADASQLRQALSERARTSAKARWELFHAVEDYADRDDERRYMAKKRQRPMRPRNVKGGVSVAKATPINDSLFARFVNGKYEIKREAATVAPKNPVVQCQEELASTRGRARRAKIKECKRVAANWKRFAKARAQQDLIERERRERERIRRDREENRRRLELRNRSLTY